MHPPGMILDKVIKKCQQINIEISNDPEPPSVCLSSCIFNNSGLYSMHRIYKQNIDRSDLQTCNYD